MRIHRSNRSRSHPSWCGAELFLAHAGPAGAEGGRRGRAACALSVARAAAVMGNQHSASHAALKPRKNVHWKSAGKPSAPGKPDIIPLSSEDEPNAITLKWAPAIHDGGAPLHGYQVECNRLGSQEWIRTSPKVVVRPELLLTGLEPAYRYQFRVAALNAVGCSEYSELSDVLTISSDRLQEAPKFLQRLEDTTALENDTTEFRVTFTGSPTPTISWYKDDSEIFSSRRTAITTNETSSVLVFHQTAADDEGEIKCTATNCHGYAVVKAKLSLEAAPKLRYPRQYEDGLLFAINETVYLKPSIVGKPLPTVEWRHNGQPIIMDDRIEITNTPKFSILKIHSAKRSDRGEYQIQAKNRIGEDTVSFLVTITGPPDPPRRVSVTRQVDKSVTLDWEPPEDDGGCRIGNYVIEYYRSGWNVWLKFTTSRKTSATLIDLIEGSEYRFRVKAESPYGMSAPSVESAPVKIPGRPVDMEFLAVESRIINEVMTREDGEEPSVSPAPRRKRNQLAPPEPDAPKRRAKSTPTRERAGSNEFMLVLYPDSQKSAEKIEKRKSFQLDLEDALSPPPISLSAPELSTRSIMPFKALRNAVSSTELLHEQAMARFYKAVAMKEEQTKQKEDSNKPSKHEQHDDIPHNSKIKENTIARQDLVPLKTSEVEIIETVEERPIYDNETKIQTRQMSHDSDVSDNKWQSISFDEDYTASTVSSEGEYSDDGSFNGDIERGNQLCNEDEVYNPRDKIPRPSPIKEIAEEEEENSESETLKPKLPLLDPNFVPKPILKRRETDIKPEVTNERNSNFLKKSKKDEKITIFKRITKMPVQKSFPFPKLLGKKEPNKTEQENLPGDNNKIENKVDKVEDKLSDEGKTVIDYYGSIVKEYGSLKKSAPPLYLNTEDLKNVAEKQQLEIKGKAIGQNKKTKRPTSTGNKTKQVNDLPLNSVAKSPKQKPKTNVNKSKIETTVKSELNQLQEKKSDETTRKIILQKTEQSKIVIPINYKELEEKATSNVRSAIVYTVDICLLLLAFWLYFFKDVRLAIPFLILIIYRKETIKYIQDWIRNHMPTWLKNKTS